MWDKETEVDRFRERVPLSNLVSQCKLANIDPSQPKPRDWTGPIMEAAKGGKFVLIPECKRMEPISGSLRKRYDIAKIVTEFTAAGAPAISVNCDAVLFGGSLEDITTAREASSKAALERASEDGVVVPPVMASDLLLYPYQLYKMRLAGADAVNMVAAALSGKDMLYLAKIAQALNMQALLSVTSTAQIKALDIIPAGGISALVVSNRDLEDFSFDMTGQQALKLLQSEELQAFRAKQGEGFPIFVEGRVGLIDAFGEPDAYLEALHEAGATGAIVAAGMAPDESGEVPLKTFMEC
jgi:indole-3-glycerol phosphate synthase